MAKEVFGEYAAFSTPGGIRFQKGGKMTSENALPPEVVAYLKDKIGTQVDVPASVEAGAKFPMPTEEEKARLREESLRVPDALKLSPEDEANRVIPDNEAPLTPDDFDEPLDDPALPQEPAETPHAPEPGERLPSNVDPSFMESVSIHTAPLADIARALYDRFGIYSVYLNMLPQSDEVNPLTGESFSKYHLGIAYQAAIAAQAKGLSNPEVARKQIDEGRSASENFQDQFVPVAHTLGEARRQDSFAFRTSVQSGRPQVATQIQHVKGEDGMMHAIQVEVPIQEHGGTANSRYDADEDEMVLEPPIYGTKPIIKPNW